MNTCNGRVGGGAHLAPGLVESASGFEVRRSPLGRRILGVHVNDGTSRVARATWVAGVHWVAGVRAPRRSFVAPKCWSNHDSHHYCHYFHHRHHHLFIITLPIPIALAITTTIYNLICRNSIEGNVSNSV